MAHATAYNRIAGDLTTKEALQLEMKMMNDAKAKEQQIKELNKRIAILKNDISTLNEAISFVQFKR